MPDRVLKILGMKFILKQFSAKVNEGDMSFTILNTWHSIRALLFHRINILLFYLCIVMLHRIDLSKLLMDYNKKEQKLHHIFQHAQFLSHERFEPFHYG